MSVPGGEGAFWSRHGRRLAVALLTLAALWVAWAGYRGQLVPRQAEAPANRWLLTGDEPAYLLAAQAMAAGEGLDLWPAHQRGDHLRFWDRDIVGPDQYTWAAYQATGRPVLLDRSAWWGGKQIKHHMPLLPLVLAPATRTGPIRWSAGVTLALLLAGGAAACLWRWLPARGAGQWRVAGAVFVVLAGLPVGYYTCQLYPEALAVALLLTGCSLLCGERRLAQGLGWVALFAALWATPRVTGGVVAAALLGTGWYVRQRTWRLAWLPALGLALYLAYHLFLWGWICPPAYDPYNQPSARLIPVNFARLLFDNQVGLLFLNPALGAGLAAAVVLVARRGRTLPVAVWLLLWIGTVVGVAVLPTQRAGMCAAGRYEVIPAALLVVPLAELLAGGGEDRWRRRVGVMLAGLSLAGLAIAVWVARDPRLWFRAYHPLFGYPSLQPFYDLLPRAGSPWFWPGVAAWSAAWLATLFAYDAGRLAWRALRPGTRSDARAPAG